MVPLLVGSVVGVGLVLGGLVLQSELPAGQLYQRLIELATEIGAFVGVLVGYHQIQRKRGCVPTAWDEAKLLAALQQLQKDQHTELAKEVENAIQVAFANFKEQERERENAELRAEVRTLRAQRGDTPRRG